MAKKQARALAKLRKKYPKEFKAIDAPLDDKLKMMKAREAKQPPTKLKRYQVTLLLTFNAFACTKEGAYQEAARNWARIYFREREFYGGKVKSFGNATKQEIEEGYWEL